MGNILSPFKQRKKNTRDAKKAAKAAAKANREKFEAWQNMPQDEWTPERRFANNVATDEDRASFDGEVAEIQKMIHETLPKARSAASDAGAAVKTAAANERACLKMVETATKAGVEDHIAEANSMFNSAKDNLEELESVSKSAHLDLNGLEKDLSAPKNRRRVAWLERHLGEKIQ